MDSNSLIKELKRLNLYVFTTNDIKIITNSPYANIICNRLCKRGIIQQIERGKYCLPGTSPYIIASRILTPSYIALTSAFRFHNITTQLPIKIIVFSTKYHKMLKGIKFIKVSKRLMFGYDEYNNAYVSDVEKTFIDDIWYHKGKLHADEELEIAIMKKTLNLEKLKSYAQVLMDKKVVRELRIKLKKFNINF